MKKTKKNVGTETLGLRQKFFIFQQHSTYSFLTQNLFCLSKMIDLHILF